MPIRNDPVISDNTSIVNYPSCLFSLEKDEIIPYERLAYNILHGSLLLLPKKKLPYQIEVDFNNSVISILPWALNASIKINYSADGNVNSYIFSIPQYAPSLFYLFSIILCNYIFVDKKIAEEKLEDEVAKRIQYFLDGASCGVRAYKTHGLSFAIRASYDYFDLSMQDLYAGYDMYDLLSKYISFHEIAHAYTLEIESDSKNLKPIDKCAYEIIADLLASTWLFIYFLHNTPDTEEYRKLKKIDSYAECIKVNSIMCLNTLISTLFLYAIAGAQSHGGSVTLDGGTDHPNGLSRFSVTSSHFINLIHSNYSDILSGDQLDFINSEYWHNLDLIIRSGIVKKADMLMFKDSSEKENIQRASEIIKNKKIEELLPIVSFLMPDK